MFHQREQEESSSTADARGSESATEKSSFAPPTISLPKGGGAIGGMGEKFAANPATGTGSLTVPISITPGRNNFSPQLALSYDSGNGNGAFGFGWNLSLPAITRKTEKSLPQYRDAEESDVFILSGTEDLVPALVKDLETGEWKRQTLHSPTHAPGYRIDFYRPRTEGLFARLERWTNKETGEAHWRSISKDNVTTLYGKREDARIADPHDERRVFSWLICESFDDKGNATFYEYKQENDAGINRAHPEEKNRLNDGTAFSNRYLKRIKYGNPTPRQKDEDLSARKDWLFEVVFDYGEHDAAAPVPADALSWSVRQDAFSSYRAGFEVRTYRLCKRVLMFHHFTEQLGAADYLVRSTIFHYTETPVASFIKAIEHCGHKLKPDGTRLKKSLPLLEFAYSVAKIDEQVRALDAESIENLPAGLDGAGYQFIDLESEGVPGILTEQSDAWFYKRNLSPITVSKEENKKPRPTARFAPLEMVAARPSLSDMDDPRQQIMNLTGDGLNYLVKFAPPLAGYFKQDADGDWESFKPFALMPNVNWNDPNLKFIDLTGDGLADLLISEDEVFLWYPSRGKDGFGPAGMARKFRDEEKNAAVVFADARQTVHLADMSGDGLADIVRIRNGEVCYWPNLGYGRFGSKVTMRNAPFFDHPDQFDQKRIRLADVDGSGVTDIIYLGRKRVSIFFNESGNGWSAPHTLKQFPETDNVAAVVAVDLLGNGTACLVWSSSLAKNAPRPIRYIDLMGGQKPHLLVSVRNNMGAETRVEYAPSTKFCLQDRLDGRPWITKLPFPVHVIERIETFDHISKNRFVSRYAYHHGYYDGAEREFRGFGMVEQLDTEEFDALTHGDNFPVGVNIDKPSHVPPVLTRTWFHTGAYLEGRKISRHFADEYYGAPDLTVAEREARLLPDTVLPSGLLPAEECQAHRALKGSILRQEIYAVDDSIKRAHPYSVSEQNYTVEWVQPQKSNRHAVFFVHPREKLDYYYERDSKDPRTSHQLTLEVDPFGNVLKSAAIGYGRLPLDSIEEHIEQTRTLITSTEMSVTNSIEQPHAYRAPLVSETRAFEIHGLELGNQQIRFTFDQALNAVKDAAAIPYEEAPDGELQKRLIEHTRALYRNDDFTAALPLGQLNSLALPFESYKLAFTPGLLTKVYETRVAAAMLSTDGAYVPSEGDVNWWIPSGRVFYSPDGADTPADEIDFARQHFFLPRRFRNPFGQTSVVEYDALDLLITQTVDPLGNVTRARQDYLVMQPSLVTDPNGNRVEAAFDALGMVTGTAIMGKDGENLGDSLLGFEADLDDETVTAHIQSPLVHPHNILQRATTRLVYDLFQFQNTSNTSSPQPNVVYTLARETHDSDLATGEQTAIQHSFLYSDGFGRELQKKIQAEAGPLVTGGAQTSPRWVGTGWTIYNNKGKPVKKYEPFFTDTHEFEVKIEGISSTLFYDPLERVVATLHPNHTYEKVVFNAWQQASWDVNDTVLQSGPNAAKNDPKDDADVGDFFSRLPDDEYLPAWHTQRSTGALGAREQSAAAKTTAHAGTPTLSYLDSLGRTFLTIADNAAAGKYHTRIKLDIEGNQRAVIDAWERVVIEYDYDLLGNKIKQTSMDADARWMLSNATGKPIYGWNMRGHRLRWAYDALERPTSLLLQSNDEPQQPTDETETPGNKLERLVERTVYGEAHASAATLNLRGKTFMLLDGAGVVTNAGRNPETDLDEAYDFKGNLLRSQRQLAREYKKQADWSVVEPLLKPALPSSSLNLTALTNALAPLLESEIFKSGTTYDALNRPITITAPDGSIIRPAYNEANLLERVTANLRKSSTVTVFVDDIDYDAKGQRESIRYGNGVTTTYAYDPQTFRLSRLQTLRGAEHLQDLHYTYDPVGNITSIRDDAQQTIYFNNQIVAPDNDYTYDALYRLTSAEGREHIGQLAQPSTSHDDLPRTGQPHPSDGNAMRRYTEHFELDKVGNILRVVHEAINGNWTRDYAYTQPSVIEPALHNNRLSRTTVGSTTVTYQHDEHGNMIVMPHLGMGWDFKDQLQKVDLGGGGKAFYVYDANGQRVRKVWEKSAALIEERIYLGGYEVFRRKQSGTLETERETLHIMDDKQRIALVETKTINDVSQIASPQSLIRYQFSNHLGSSSLELDGSAQIISYEEYYPYGSTSFQAANNSVEVSAKRYRYTGKERDEESGLYYHGARHYAPWLGRWTSCDPKGLADGVNVYAYVSGNPVRLTDPSGTEAVYDEEVGECRVEYPTCTAENPAGVMSTPPTRTVSRAHPAPRPPAPPSRVTQPAAIPQVSGPDYTLHVPQGAVYTQYQNALREMENSDNSIGARIGMGVLATLASPLALAEEYLARPIANIPFTVHNAGVGAGEHMARGYLLWQAGERGEALVEGLSVVRDLSTGFVAAASVAAPIAGAVEGNVSRATATTATERAVEFAGGTRSATTRSFVPDLSHVTGRTAATRNATINATIAQDLPHLRLTFRPQYNPFLQPFAVASRGEGTQIGRLAFSSRRQLIDTIVHEELHHRWWQRGLTNHHGPLLDARFEYTVQRYMRLRGFIQEVPFPRPY